VKEQRRFNEPVWVTAKAAPPVRYYAGKDLQLALLYPTVAGSLPDSDFDQRQAMTASSVLRAVLDHHYCKPEDDTTELFHGCERAASSRS
jgi:hypothetical protein